MCQGASLVNTIWLDHGVFAAARQLVAGCRVAPRRAARAAAREATASGAWTVQAVGRREHRVVAPSSPSRRGRREMRCNATSTATASGRRCGREVEARRSVLRVRARDERGASTGMMLHKSTGISMWRARGDLGLSLYTDMARPSACGVKAVTQRNGSDAFSFLRCWRKKHDPFLQKKTQERSTIQLAPLFCSNCFCFSKCSRSQLQVKLVPLVLQVDQRTLRIEDWE